MASNKVVSKMTDKKTSAFRDRINESYKTQNSLNVKDIDLADLASLIGLLALLRTWSTEKLEYIQPLNTLQNILCPTTKMTQETVGNLYQFNLLNIDLANSPDTAFVENDDHSIAWYTFQAALKPSFSTSDRILDIQESIAILLSIIPCSLQPWQTSQLQELMRAIAVAECIQYHQYILSEYGFDEPVGEKTQLIFEELLDSLPVSCIIPCIWASVKSAAAFLQTPLCKGRKHAFNTIQGKIRETATKRLSGELQNKPFVRGAGCERSQISIELYSLLGLDGDVGFTEHLAGIDIPKTWKKLEEDNEYKTGAKFTTHEKLVLEEWDYYECSDSWFERQLTYLDREVVVRKVLSNPCYEVRVNDVSNIKEPTQIASALMNDFTSVAVFIDSLEKSEKFELQTRKETEAGEE